MTYLFDTNALVGIITRKARLLERVYAHELDEFRVSAIVAHELYFGAFKSQRTTQNIADFEELRFQVLDFTNADAKRAGSIRAALRVAGTPIGPYDVLIAGQALARGLVLITRNLREFARVEGLQAENWED